MLATEMNRTTYSFFSEMTPAQQRVLEESGQPVQFPGGCTIGRAGEPASRFYIIAGGSVRLQAFVSERGPVTIEVVSAGEPFAWSSLVPPYRLHYDIVALEPVSAIAFDPARIRGLCASDPDLGCRFNAKLAALIGSRVQATRLQLIGTFIGDPKGRGWV